MLNQCNIWLNVAYSCWVLRVLRPNRVWNKMKLLYQQVWVDLYLQTTEMQIQIKSNFLDSGYKIGKSGKDSKSKTKSN